MAFSCKNITSFRLIKQDCFWMSAACTR
ncbi:unnamed protein product [Acanthoscelides obtectus]|uniref:Uncharacterized protein n=1 Tax=Acanthoscelides obtectus TaxID=200917 RepID=A0A9P0KK87_ACAOB|nr:unnamed protein product [Acanthoscelides obtectus]CAK1653722.1 hypothetical protein AOBTE_LOCUS18343 [Acanthoscelides obtectus]